MTPETQATATLINAADKDGYSLYVTGYSHTYIRQATIHTRLVSQHLIYNGRLFIFLFKGDDLFHTAVLCIYAYQRAHKSHDPTTKTHTIHRVTPIDTDSPQLFKHIVFAHTNGLRTLYTPLILIIMGECSASHGKIPEISTSSHTYPMHCTPTQPCIYHPDPTPNPSLPHLV